MNTLPDFVNCCGNAILETYILFIFNGSKTRHCSMLYSIGEIGVLYKESSILGFRDVEHPRVA